jgi:hypothetical protein
MQTLEIKQGIKIKHRLSVKYGNKMFRSTKIMVIGWHKYREAKSGLLAYRIEN